MRLIGFLVAAIGIVLLAVGLSASDSPLDQASQFLTGQYADATLWYVIAGLAAIVAGALLAAFGPRRI